MTERASQSADGSGIAQADNGATATVNYSTHHHYAPESPRPTRAIHLNPPPALFIGREPELAALHQYLAREGAVVYIPGFPGRGKSTLANFYAHQHKDEYQTVHWLPCHAKSLVEVAAEFAWQLELKLDGDLEANLKHLRAHCARNRCLLILDNVDDEAPAGMLLGGRSSVILTTWHTNLKFLRPVPAIPLPVFTEDQCFELFRTRFGANEVDRHLAESRLLFERLERHPFALDIAASLIVEDPRYTIAGMAKNLPTDIPALFAEAVATLSPAARSLLAAMASCALEGFRLSLAAEVAGFDETAALDALYEIRARSLTDELDRDTHRYRLHALVREAAHATNALRARHAEIVLTQFESWETDWGRCEEDFADWRTALTWLLEQPGDQAWTKVNGLAILGFSLAQRLGRLTEAYGVAATLADCAENRDDAVWMPTWLNNKALILADWGQLHEAMSLFKRVEEIGRRANAKAGLSIVYGNQARILLDWGRLEEAMSLHKRQEIISLELGDKEGVAVSYGNQAVILLAWKLFEDAMVILKRAEEVWIALGHKAGLQACYGNQALVLANQALILNEASLLEDAMILLQRQKLLCIELGDKAALATNYGNQARIHQSCGHALEAFTLHLHEERLCRELDDKAGLANCYASQGLLARQTNDTAIEREKLRQALALFTELGMPRQIEKIKRWLDRANGLSEPEAS